MQATWAGRLVAVLGIFVGILAVSLQTRAAEGDSPPEAPATTAPPATAPPAAESTNAAEVPAATTATTAAPVPAPAPATPQTPAAATAAVVDPETTPIDTAAIRAELKEKLKEPTDKTGKGDTAAIPKPLREILEERGRLLDDWDKALAARHDAENPKVTPETQIANLKAEIARTKATLDQAAKDASTLLPSAFRRPTKDVNESACAEMKEVIDATKTELKDWKTKLEKLRTSEAARSTITTLTALRAERDKIHQQVTALPARRRELDSALTAAKTADDRTLASERITNFEWETRVLSERLLGQEARIALEMKLLNRPALTKQNYDTHVQLVEQTLAQMQARYKEQSDVLERQLTTSANSKQSLAERSQDPLERYQARCEAQLLELEAEVIKHEKLLAASPPPTPEEQRILADRAENALNEIKELLEDGRFSHLDALRFNNDFRRIGPERARIVSRELATATKQLAYFENLLSSVELDLFQDKRIDQYEHETLLEQLPAEKHDRAKKLFTDIDRRHEELLNKNRDVLIRLAARAEATQKEIERRIAFLDDQYGFIRTHIFWVRDQEPLGVSTVIQAQRGSYVALKALGRLLLELSDRTLWGRISVEFLISVAFLVILPWPLLRLQRSLGTRAASPEACSSTTWILTCRALLFGIASSLLWPGYIGLLAYAARQAPWPRNFALMTASCLLLLAPALALLKISRWMFQQEGWAEKQFRIPTEVTRQLARATYFLVFIGTPLVIPQILLEQSLIAPGGRPVSVPGFTRILGLGVEVLLWSVVFYLTRGKSPFILWLPEFPSRLKWLNTRRRQVCAAWLVGLGGIVFLDTLGYSFTAQRLMIAAGQGVVLIAVCSGVYRILLRLIDQHAWRWIRMGSILQATEGQNGAAPPADLANRLRRLAAYLVPIFGVLTAAWLWNIDWALFQTIGDQVLIPGDEKTVIKVGNAVQCVAIMAITSAIWHHMSTFFAVAIFPRMNDDPGIRFAVVTLSRYVVLALGVLAGLSSIHLGLEKIGMVLAALGVGLGFGLQEIVSNFVCGIILLLERPIRVGDTVTVSGMSGKVDRINIRATTIINGDNQSIIVPNRAFITSDLVNWTLKDKIIRVSIRVRVAHGTDPDKVSELLLRIAREDADVLRNPLPASFMEDFSDSALTFVLHVHVPDPSLGSRVRHRLFAQIQKRFAEAEIEIPLPRHELRVHPVPETVSRSLTAEEVVRHDAPSPTPPTPRSATTVPVPQALEDCHRGVDE